MAEYIRLPDGSYLQLKDGQSPLEGLMAARQLFPDLFKTEPEALKRDTTGLKAAAAAGFERLGGEFELLKGKTGFKDQAEAQREYEAAQKRAEARFTPTEKGWTEDPFLKFRETLGGSLPSMVAPAAAGLAALALPVAAPVAIGAGLLGAGAVSAGQFTGSNLARQVGTGKSLEEASLGKAVGAAVPQALFDTAAMALIPGVGKLFGSVGSKLTTEQAKAIASQTLGRTVADYTAKTGMAMGREGFTEAVQQSLERLQAGLNIADDDARKEYAESFIGGAVLGGAIAPVGRYIERSGAKTQAAKADREDRLKEAAAAAEQERVAAEKEAAEKQTPEYALQVANQLKTLEQEKLGLQRQIRKVSKDSSTEAEDKAFNKVINNQLRINEAARSELAPEVNRLKQAGIYDQALEQERVAGMSPMDYLLERTKTVQDRAVTPVEDTAYEESGLAFADPLVPSVERRKAEEAERARVAALPAAYAAERVELARTQLYEPSGQDYVEYLLQDPYKAGLIVETRTPLPGLTASESALIRNSLASRLKKEGKAELAGRQDELKAQVPGKTTANPMEQFLADQDMLDVARQEGMTESEIAAVERMARMQRGVIEQGDLFGEQRVGQAAGVQQRETIADKLDELNRQLQVAYVQRNADRGAQYRETIRGLVEQIRDLQSKMQLPTAGQLGAKSKGLQEQLGQLPESLKAQANAAAEVEKNLYGLAQGKNEEQVRGVLDNLVAGIRAVRGDLRPETITQIEQQAQPILDMVARYGGEAVPGALQRLEALGQRWRAGTERGETFTRTATPTETTATMLRDQMDVAFANRERYDADTLAIMEQVADNFGAVAVDPERRNLVGEWLNRATVTGKPSPEMTADVRNELARLEQGKRSETETPMRQTAFGLATKPTVRVQQLELPGSMMPKAVRGESKTTVESGKAVFAEPGELAAPAKKATTFDTAEEFQKFLASDAVKQLRQEAGLTKDTASRMHQRMELFRKKYENIVNIARARVQVLNERKQALEKLKDTESRAAKELLADAQIRLNNVQARLDEELQALQIAYIEADLQASQSAEDAAALSQQIADNVAKFEQADAKAVAAAKATADAKAELAKIMQQPVNKKTFSAMRKAQQAVVAALREQRSASAGVPRMVSFLNEDLRLQLQLTEALEKKEADARALVEAGQILRAEAARQKRRVLYKKEFLPAQKNLAAALELSGTELRKITGSIDAELAQIDKDIATASATARAGEEKLAPKEAPKSAFEQKLAETKIEPLTRAEKDAIEARDKAELEAFQATTARLAAVSGVRIDASQRREMWRALEDKTKTNAELDSAIERTYDGIEELQSALTVIDGAIAGAKDRIEEIANAPAPAEIYKKQDTEQRAKNTEEQKQRISELERKRKTAAEGLARLQAASVRLEKERANFQKALINAERATSNDPEVYKAVTAQIDARIEKLQKNIAENEERIAKSEAKSGRKAETKTLAQAKKRVGNYKRNLKQLEEARANRFGIKRIDVLTGETVAGQIAAAKRAEQGKAEPQKRVDVATQERIDAENERAEKFNERNTRLLELQLAQAALEAAKEPKTAVKKAERAEKLRKLQKDINKQIDLVNEVRPKVLGRVTAAARVQSSAPSKFRTGTQESRETPGYTRQPIVEKRVVAAPTVSAAAQEANEFADRLERAKDRTTLLEEAADKSLAQQAAILAAVDNNVRRYAREVDKLETERDTLQAAVDSAKEKEIQIPAVTIERLNKVREQLGLYNQSLARAEAAKADVEAAQEAAPTLEGENVSTIKGTKMGVAPDKDFYDNDLDDTDAFEFSRGTPADGGQTVAALEKALDKAVGDPGVAGKRIKIFQSVSDFFSDPAYKYDYEGANIPADAKAFVNPKNGQAFMFADNIGKGEELGVLLHEIGVHIGFRNLFNKAQYARLVSAVKSWASRKDNSLEARIAKRAVARVEAAETTADQYDDELLAYAVEEAVKAGVNPNALQGGSPIRNWLKAVLDVLRNALSKYGINPKTLTTGDLVNMAYGAAQLELRGTWHGSDAVFTAFDSRFLGMGEGAYEQRFAGSTNLGRGPYVTPNKEYAEYYQHAVPFGKAANTSGYGSKTYQDYRSMDEMFLTTPHEDLSTAALQSKFESRLVTAYLKGVSAGQELDPTQNKKAIARLEQLQKGVRNAKEQKAVATLSLEKIKALAERPTKGNLYRTLDDIPRAKVFGVNEQHVIGERPKLDALMRKYAYNIDRDTADESGRWAGNSLFYNMRDKLGIDKTIELLKDAGIEAIEAKSEGKYIERAYIDQAPEILGVNLSPVGPATGKGRPGTGTLLFSRGTPNALTDLADKLTTKPKTLREKFSSALVLEAEQAGVDMRAGLREALKAGAEGLGDTKLFTQTMYNVLKADQKMPLVYTVMSRGPLELYKDDKGFFGVRSSNKNSAVDVFAAINELPVANDKKMAVAQAYLVAQRATNKGLEKLDTGALGIKESDLQAALAAAKADPKLGTALEKVRRVYNAYNKGMIDFLAATGAIPKAAAAKLNAAGDYVPFYRVNANGNASLVFDGDTMVAIGDIRRQPYLAELKGGEDRLLPLDEAIPRNTILLTDKALTNMATKSVAYGLQAIGKGAGPADPKTGKPTNKMAIHSGKGPADPGTIRFNQEPDPNDPEDTGDRWVKVDTANTLAEGVPTALLVKSLEGAHLPLPGFLKLAGAATDILRTGVTRTPLYIARQLIREPMAAAFTGGLNYNTFTAVLKANKEFVKMVRGNSEAEAKLLEKGLIQSGIFTGDVDDMGKFALQLVKGDQNAFEKVFALADKAAIKADAATRALVYKNALANGLSEVEADMATMESMNFYKRGTNAAVQYFGRLIPFFNAQIQGLNVLFKAARGRMPFEEQQEIKRKFRNNAMLLTATGIVYAMAMEDDETWRNARPRDKMSNFFIPLPGTDEMLKIPIPFEAGYFYSLAVAAVDGMREQTDNAAQWKAIKDLFLNSVPGYSSMGVPQLVKPVFEVWTNKNFLSGAPIESLRLQGLNPEERYNATTTEFAKMLSRALPVLSPIQIEHIVRGYLGVLPLAVVASANSLFEREGAGEKPEKRLSEMALVGTTFQKKYGGADADVVFEAAKDAIDARSTMNKILNEGRRQDAITFRDENRVELALAPAAGQYRQLIGRINSDLRRTQERGDLTAIEKRQRIDKLEEAKQQAANRFLELRRRTEASLGQR